LSVFRLRECVDRVAYGFVVKSGGRERPCRPYLSERAAQAAAEAVADQAAGALGYARGGD
jgi:hypothetical protein